MTRVRCGCSTPRSAGRSLGCCRSRWDPWSSPRAGPAVPSRARRRAGRSGAAGSSSAPRSSRSPAASSTRYYTAELAPAIAALAAAGLVTAWRWQRSSGAARFALPGAVAGTALLAYVLLGRTPDWLPWLRYTVLALALLAVVAAFLRAPRVTVVIGLVAIVAGPTAFVADTAVRPVSVLETADPERRPAVDGRVAHGRRHQHGPSGRGRVRPVHRQRVPAQPRSARSPRVRADVVHRDRTGRRRRHVRRGPVPAEHRRARGAAGRLPRLRSGAFGRRPAAVGGGRDDCGSCCCRWSSSTSAAAPRGSGRTAAAATDAGELTRRVGWEAKHCRPVPPARIGPDAATAGVLFDCGVRQ